MRTIHSLRPATESDFDDILGLIEGAARWLHKEKQLDQWQRPWPSQAARDQRIRDGLAAGATWIARQDGIPVGTITVCEKGDPKLWRPEELTEKAVYAHRLVVNRSFTGRGLGRELMEWAGRHGQRHWGATCIRIDVWTTNKELRDYYVEQGFRLVREDETGYLDYPAEALMEKDIRGW